MTMRTPSMVSALSARSVASTTLRLPAGAPAPLPGASFHAVGPSGIVAFPSPAAAPAICSSAYQSGSAVTCRHR